MSRKRVTTVERIIRDSNRASEVIRDIRDAGEESSEPHNEPVDLNDLDPSGR